MIQQTKEKMKNEVDGVGLRRQAESPYPTSKSPKMVTLLNGTTVLNVFLEG